MAKIYETKEDVERERLTQEVKDARDSQSQSAAWTGASIALMLFGFLMKKKPSPEQVIKEESFMGNMAEHLRDGSSFRTFFGISTFFNGWGIYTAGKKAQKLEAELQKLGPEQKKIASAPAETPPTVVGEGGHVARLQNNVTENSAIPQR